ncbi:MAG: hypothetical protein KAW41_06235 [Candidatus Diapherotrites archaeon]|nr:hypothetical protein [Candidatus Diapherotrites archaeon]
MTKWYPVPDRSLGILKAMARTIETDMPWTKKFILTSEATQDIIRSRLPKKTRVLGRKFFKDVLEIQNTLHLVLVMHLYFERFLDAIITKRLKNPKRLLDERYYLKLEIISALGILDNELYRELKFVNYLRNQYAHRLDYTMEDLEKIPNPSLKKMFAKIKKVRGTNKRKKLYHTVLQYYFYFLMMDLSFTFRELFLL